MADTRREDETPAGAPRANVGPGAGDSGCGWRGYRADRSGLSVSDRRVLRDLVFNRLLHELEIQAGGPPRSTTNTVASVSASLPAVSIGPKRLSGSGRGGGARPN